MMISSRDAKKKASAIEVPQSGEIVTMTIEVFCAWMKMNQLKARQWRGSLLVVEPIRAMEKQEDSTMEAQ